MDSKRAEELEPIAIVGIGCRFPGGADRPDSFWKLLCDGVDAVTEVPPDRWSLDAFYDPNPGVPGKTYSKWGGFVEDVSKFEPQFFGISPREATFMDPQQRLLLEVAWEAIEDAGWAAKDLAGTQTGVFVGVSISDYGVLQGVFDQPIDVDPHMATGGALSIVANRVSYCLNLVGPSVSVDTACSSSLVAIDVACRRIWNGDCTVALAGGVNLMLTPAPFLAFSAATMLARDGKCKTFDAKADGFVRGEGAGMIVLKPLSQAKADCDPVYALIKGTDVNQDGRTSGIAVPSESSQSSLIEKVCNDAGIDPSHVDYVEAHGTGTAVGDPIEVRALGSVFGAKRENGADCVLGSVKTNIGHLESAAGIAGLIKATLVLKNRAVPKHLNLKEVNPAIDLGALKMHIPRELEPLSDRGRPLIAAVNSFGFGGTNAHVILEEYCGRDQASEIAPANRPFILPLSARTPESLEQLATAYHDVLSQDAEGREAIDDLCYTAAIGRNPQSHRAVIVARDVAGLTTQLQAAAAADWRAISAKGERAQTKPKKVAFVFSGQGSQWWGMGQQLLEQEPVFRETIKACDALMSPYADWSLLDEMQKDKDASQLQKTRFAQPALFALQVGLTRLLHSLGIECDAVCGHSVGEIAAAHVSGALSLEEACRVAIHRGQAMDQASSRGRMLAVGLTSEMADDLIADLKDTVSIAAINGPNSVTLSGDPDALESLSTGLSEREVFNRFLEVEYAFHSPQMEPVQAALFEALPDIVCQATTVPMVSTVTALQAGADELNADYWWRNVRDTVRFTEAFGALCDLGCDVFVEIGPHPVLSSAMTECLMETSKPGKVIPTLRRNEDEQVQILTTYGALYCEGVDVDWSLLWPMPRQRIHAPTYPWNREDYWNEAAEIREHRIGTDLHPLLGRRKSAADPMWQGILDLRVLKYLEDHKVREMAVFPAAGYIEMALAMARGVSDQPIISLEDVRFRNVLHLPIGERGPRSQSSFHEADGSFSIHSGTGSDSEWLVHASGYLRTDQQRIDGYSIDLKALSVEMPHVVGAEECYQKFRDVGISYGPAFQGVKSFCRSERQALGTVELDDDLLDDTARYLFHPALLDSCFQVLGGVLPSTNTQTYLPVYIEQIIYHRKPGRRVRPHVKLLSITPELMTVDIKVYDPDGTILVEFNRFVLQETGAGKSGGLESLLYHTRWQEQPTDQVDDLGQLPPAPSMAELAKAVLANSVELSDGTALIEQLEREIEELQEPHHCFDELAVGYIINALVELGLNFEAGSRIESNVIDALPIAEAHNRLFSRFLEIVVDAGYLAREPDSNDWTVLKSFEKRNLHEEWRTLLYQYPSSLAELNLLGRCGSGLADVLCGQVDPLTLMFPDGSMNSSEALYQDSPSFLYLNKAIRCIVGSFIDKMPPQRRIRILEVGGGTGGLTSHIAPILPPDRTQYVFTDISSIFFANIEGKLRAHDFIEVKTLDIDRNPLDQGFEAGSFDIIVASDVLHATRDLKRSIENIKSLLASDGLFVFLEVAQATPWLDTVFGLIKGWWQFEDHDLRPDYPLIGRQEWATLLADLGFSAIESVPPRIETTQIVMWGQGPTRHAVIDEVVSIEDAADQDAGELTDPVPAEDNDNEPGVWIVLSDSGGLGQQIQAELSGSGDVVHRVRSGDAFSQIGEGSFLVARDQPEDYQRLFSATLGDNRKLKGIINLWPLDGFDCKVFDGAILQESEKDYCHSLMHLIQAAEKRENQAKPYKLLLVTRGAQMIGDAVDAPSLLHAELIGMGRVICNELADVDCKMLDLSIEGDRTDAQTILSEALVDDHEEEVAIRNGLRFVPRLAQQPTETLALGDLDNDNGFRLESLQPGVLDRVTIIETKRRPPGSGEVEIEVHAAALNFRDVLKALDLYPKDSPDAMTFGDECSGVIVAIGDDVLDFEVGDEVMAFATGSLASHITVPTIGVLKKPPHLSFEDAATMPVAFLTANYALHSVGRIQAGESALIHAATGGVGLAALQVAERAGAKVFTTAGSTEKRRFLELYGIEDPMNSRTLDFATDVKHLTNGRGVDVVLNSLAGKAISKGLSCLAPYGRFLEIGKRDIYEDNSIGLWPFHKNLSFLAIDLGQILTAGLKGEEDALQEFSRAVWTQQLHPLPYRSFPISRISDALRYMGQARHIGKIVVTTRDADIAIRRPTESAIRFRKDATYLISGGFGGLGLCVAQWIFENGGKNIVLVGRSGAKSTEIAAKVADLRNAGANIYESKTDISDPIAVKTLLSELRESMPPLKGIVHTAMVLDDGSILQLNAERFSKVTSPKANGAWNLHESSLSDELDMFIMFSSMSSVIGQQGQSNYAAANGFLDNLAHYRRANGLPGLSVNWGAVSDVGFVANDKKYAALAANSGVTSGEVLSALGHLIRKGQTQAGVFRADWRALSAGVPSGRVMSRVSDLVEATPEQNDHDGGGQVREAILAAASADQMPLMKDYLREQVGRVIGLGSGKLADDQPLNEIGLDSLMALELRVQVEKDLLLALPVTKLMQGPVTIDGLSQIIMDLMVGDAETVIVEDPAKAVSLKQTNKQGGLVTLASSDEGPVLICFPPAGGGVAVFDDMVKAMGQGVSIACLEPVTTDGGQFNSVEEVADKYLKAIRLHQPEGPYFFIGFSLGAFAAMSVTANLEEQGETISYLGMIDAKISSGTDDQTRFLANVISETLQEAQYQLGVGSEVGEFEHMQISGQLAEDLKVLPESERLDFTVEWLSRNGYAKGLETDEEYRTFVQNLMNEVRIVGQFHPPTVSAPLDIYVSDESEFGALDTDWTDYSTSSVCVETLASGHYDLMRPPMIERIAQGIKKRMNAQQFNEVSDR